MNLTDMSQLVNLNEIARTAKKYELHLRVTGAADSATGNDEINTTLANSRAQYIVSLLISRGVSEDCTSKRSIGGTDHLSPSQTNRCAHIELIAHSCFSLTRQQQTGRKGEKMHLFRSFLFIGLYVSRELLLSLRLRIANHEIIN